MKRTFQITLGVVAGIPFLLGILQLVNGASMFIPEDMITLQLDSHIRFSAVWFMIAAFINWWMIPDIEQHGGLFRLVFITMAFAGVARFLSMYLLGATDPMVIGVALFEIGLLVLIPWQAAVARRFKHEAVG